MQTESNQEVGKSVSKGRESAVCVFLEQTDGLLEDVSLEVLGKARQIADQLGSSVTAILLGQNLENTARECLARGADCILLGESPLLKDFTTEAYSKVIFHIFREEDPDIFLVGATHNGTSLAASLAIKSGAGLMAHVVDLDIEKETRKLLGAVPGFGGNIVAVCKCKRGKPQMATVRPGIFKPLSRNDSGRGEVIRINLDSLRPEDVKCRVVEKSVGKSIDISHAERVVVAGLGCKDDLSLPKKLAESFDGIVAASRPVADKGLVSKDLVVGSTGSSLNSNIAIILGVSGAAQFSCGIRDVKTVIAINSDPDAPIFKQADYCITGDLTKIVPGLLDQLESSRGGT